MAEDDGSAREGRDRLAHVPALDGLRGVAVAVVVWFHAGHLSGGFLGVDLFFTLSGYLITTLLVIEWRHQGGIGLRSFWARRARRLLPALLVLLAFVGAFAQWRVLPAARDDLRQAGLATLGYVANWWAILTGEGYWDQALAPSWLEHTWSLAIEEQFYVVWPLVAIVILRGRRSAAPWARSRERRVRLLGTVALAGAAISAALMILGSLRGVSIERLYLGTDTRVAAILLGAAAACFQRSGGTVRVLPPAHRRALDVASGASSLFLVVTWLTAEGTSPTLYRGGLLACGVAATIIILDVTTPGAGFVSRVLSLRPLRGLGAISYGLYLYHWPIFRLLGESQIGLDGWSLTVARVSLSLAAAVASYHLLERPILDGRWSWPRFQVIPAAVSVTVVVLVAGTAGGVDVAPGNVEPTRPDLGPRHAAERVPVTASTEVDAPADAEEPEPEVVTERLVDPVVLIVGDSVAYGLAEEGFVAQEEILGLTTVNGASIGCSLMVPVGSDPVPGNTIVHNCSDEWPGLVEEYQPDVVMVLFGAFVGIGPAEVDGRRVHACDPEWDALWRSRFEEAIEVLSSTGAVVDLVTAPTVPGLFEDKGTLDERQRCANEILRDIAADEPGVELIDLAEYVCPEEDCRVRVDGVNLREDGLHYGRGGAVHIARWLGPELVTVEVS